MPLLLLISTIGAWLMQSELMSFERVLELPNPEPTARIAYGSGPLQFGELRLPEGDGPHPIVVVIHGGCWRSQYTVGHIGAFSDALARAGLATWAIEYRRVGDEGGGWPGTFNDVGAATDHLREVAREHPLDLSRAVAVGHSAGGHLALWLSTRAKLGESDIRGDDPLPLSGVISLAGVDDLTRALDEGVCGDMAGQLIGGTPAEFPERYRQASPIERLPAGVPQHLINGEQDPIVPVAFGRAYRDRAERAGETVALTVIPEAGHFELIAPGTNAWESVKKAVLEMVGR